MQFLFPPDLRSTPFPDSVGEAPLSSAKSHIQDKESQEPLASSRNVGCGRQPALARVRIMSREASQRDIDAARECQALPESNVDKYLSPSWRARKWIVTVRERGWLKYSALYKGGNSESSAHSWLLAWAFRFKYNDARKSDSGGDRAARRGQALWRLVKSLLPTRKLPRNFPTIR